MIEYQEHFSAFPLCILSFPFVGLKISSLPALAFKPPKKMFASSVLSLLGHERSKQ
jgi:hypothetical protein